MRKLIALELKRNRLRPYYIAVLICGATMLGFQYLMAAIPISSFFEFKSLFSAIMAYFLYC